MTAKPQAANPQASPVAGARPGAAAPEESLDKPRRITILGATGSVGTSTADVLSAAKGRFQVEALVSNSNAKGLADQALALGARLAVVADETAHEALKARLAGTGIETAAGRAAVEEAASRPVDVVMAAMVGAAGLAPTLKAIDTGATIALANKECLVSGGPLFMRRAVAAKAPIVPVDSEHSAVFQALHGQDRDGLERIILTASGGPFRTWTREAMARARPSDALNHPNWSMGDKITIDSATMMNKGLELIEARVLFDVPPERLDVLVHPQSIVHGLIEFADGSVLAQLGAPDMRTPIAVALAWPKRLAAPAERLGLAEIGTLTFEPPDPQRFEALALARQAMRAGWQACAVLNAANEIAVQAFLEGRIGFLDIAAIVDLTLDRAEAALSKVADDDLDAILSVDSHSRRIAGDIVAKRSRSA